jgi:D-amino-acid dehydrogenase
VTGVSLGDRTMDADLVVLAAGAWSTQLAKKIGLKIPLLAGKGYGFTVVNPPETPRFPALLIEGRLAVTPMPEGLRFVGTMELGVPTHPIVNPNRVEGMRKSIKEYYPCFKDAHLEACPVWSGLRPCPPDGMPYIGVPSRYRNLIVATGHGMMGMSLGPVTGRLVGELAASQTPSVSLGLLSPDRYA